MEKKNMPGSPEEKDNMDTFCLELSQKKEEQDLNLLMKLKEESIPKEFIKPVEKGVVEAMDKGVVAGYPMVDVEVTLYDGSFHEVDSSEFAFKIAGVMAFQKAAIAARPVILEPVMKMEVVTPEDFFGQVISDLSSRRGQIKETSERVGMKVIDAIGSIVAKHLDMQHLLGL